MAETPIVVGVDPGAAHTGFVIRRADDLLTSHICDRVAHETVEEYAKVVARLVVSDMFLFRGDGLVAVGVERVTAPNVWHEGKKRLLDPSHAIGTAIVAGTVAGIVAGTAIGVFGAPATVIWVPPGHNGQGPLDAYPPELRPTRGKGAGGDRLRHARSAWDIAGQALLLSAAKAIPCA